MPPMLKCSVGAKLKFIEVRVEWQELKPQAIMKCRKAVHDYS